MQELTDAGGCDEPELMVLARDARTAAAVGDVQACITLEALRSAHIRIRALVTQPPIRDNHASRSPIGRKRPI